MIIADENGRRKTQENKQKEKKAAVEVQRETEEYIGNITNTDIKAFT